MTEPNAWGRFVTAFFLSLAVSACEDDPTRPGDANRREYAVVVNSISSSLTVFPTAQPDSSFLIGLHSEGSPVAVAVRGGTALVPLGVFPAVAVVDLEARAVTRTVPLPAASTPTGVTIVDDSLAFVTLATANAVVPILYDRGSVLAPIPTGTWPEALLYADGRVFVLNSRFDLDTFGYEGAGTITVVDAQTLDVIDTIELSGTNPGAAVYEDGSLWVLNRGDYADIGGTLSEVDPIALTEADHAEGFGFAPGGLAVFGDQLAVASFGYGVALWQSGVGFTLAPGEGFRPDPEAAVADVGVDSEGLLYIVDGQCSAPGGVYIVDAGLEVIDHADAAVCPFDITFTTF
jgi:hypothetical protein